ncbi:MAG: low-complexity tail membrane protein [Cyanobacteriota bacterium]|nr:low-complexity tail membrane protein [Cyanobacteriota bacterium]
MNPRTEPLLWIQLLGLALLPLEALLILLVLGGGEPGPAPLVEEGLCGSLGVVAPALLFWRAPPDAWSLLLAQIPVGGRRDAQRRLSRLQSPLPLKALGLGGGALALLLLLGRLDHHAAVAAPLWQGTQLPRLVALLLAALVLSVMLWQWQQALQALWLLSRSAGELGGTPPMANDELAEQRLCVGLPLLLPPSLQFATQPPRPPQPPPPPRPPRPSQPQAPSGPSAAQVSHEQPEPTEPGEPTSPAGPPEPQGQAESVAPPAEPPDPPEPRGPEQSAAPPEPPVAAQRDEESAVGGAAPAIQPEQAATDDQGGGLDQPIG